MKIKSLAIILFLTLVLAGCSTKSDNYISESGDSAKNNQNVEKNDIAKTAEEIKNEKINLEISNLSLEDKIGQIFICAFRKDVNDKNVTEINDEIIKLIKDYNLGGIVLFSENIENYNQTKKFISDLQLNAKTPLFIAVDEEGGRVTRISNCFTEDEYLIPSATQMAQSNDKEYVYKMNKLIGEKLLELGFNIDFAPVADVNTNPSNTVIGDRAYGNDPIKASECVFEAVKAIQSQGVSATLKHFPGHGDTFEDTHTNAVTVESTKERLENTEFVPFEKGIEAGADLVMVSHIKTPNVTNDNLPASLSPQIINHILRTELKFNGIIITDALNMGAISKNYDSGDAAVKALIAGNDIILMPEDFESAYNAVLDAVKQGTISEERINESLRRILSLKYDKKLIN